MAGTTKCLASIKGLMMRATRLDGCGAYSTDTCNAVVTNGFVSVDVKAQIEEGQQYQVKLADGSFAIDDQDAPQLRYYDLTAEFCNVDPDLFELAGGTSVVTNAAGDKVGVVMDTDQKDQVFALEVWTKIPGAACAGGSQEYGYFLLPMVKNGITTDFKIENNAASFSLTAQGYGNPSWSTGPYLVMPGATDTPAVLPAALTANQPLFVARTTVAPPTAVCGCQDLTLPQAA